MGIKVQDPSTGRSYDLRNLKDQQVVKKTLKRDRLTVLVVSPPCTAFSISHQGDIAPHVLAGAVEIIRFSMELCNLQHKAGRHFISEQPQSSRAWYLDDVVKM